MTTSSPKRVLILGAAGRDFHNFLTLYRDDPAHRVVGFTAEQIPNIAGRRFPPELAGPAYPEGIPIFREEELEQWIRELEVDLCIFSYSDVSHEEVMHLASRTGAAGADFLIMGASRTQLASRKPVVSVLATRTGAGKSQTTRAVSRILRERGLAVGVIRHPMPYGDLSAQRVQRFADAEDLVRHRVTIEEREEYEPHLEAGNVVWAGIDYAEIVRQAEESADVLLWDGGNNDTSFLDPDLTLVVTDPHRAGDELRYHPGETNVLLADVVIVNKVDTAPFEDVVAVIRNVRHRNPEALVLEAASPVSLDEPDRVRGRRVLAIEDGPTLTHGGMAFGAAGVAARKAGAREIIDPRPFLRGELVETFRRYPHLEGSLPAMGYGESQIRDLEETIRAAVEEGGVEGVVVGTPIDLSRLVEMPVPHTRCRYELQALGSPGLAEVLARIGP